VLQVFKSWKAATSSYVVTYFDLKHASTPLQAMLTAAGQLYGVKVITGTVAVSCFVASLETFWGANETICEVGDDTFEPTYPNRSWKVQQVEPVGYSQTSFSHLHPRSSSWLSCPSWDQQPRPSSPCVDPYLELNPFLWIGVVRLARVAVMSLDLNVEWRNNFLFLPRCLWTFRRSHPLIPLGPKLVPWATISSELLMIWSRASGAGGASGASPRYAAGLDPWGREIQSTAPRRRDVKYKNNMLRVYNTNEDLFYQ